MLLLFSKSRYMVLKLEVNIKSHLENWFHYLSASTNEAHKAMFSCPDQRTLLTVDTHVYYILNYRQLGFKYSPTGIWMEQDSNVWILTFYIYL